MSFFRRYSFEEGQQARAFFQGSQLPLSVFVNDADQFIVLTDQPYSMAGYNLVTTKGSGSIAIVGRHEVMFLPGRISVKKARSLFDRVFGWLKKRVR